MFGVGLVLFVCFVEWQYFGMWYWIIVLCGDVEFVLCECVMIEFGEKFYEVVQYVVVGCVWVDCIDLYCMELCDFV